MRPCCTPRCAVLPCLVLQPTFDEFESQLTPAIESEVLTAASLAIESHCSARGRLSARCQ